MVKELIVEKTVEIKEEGPSTTTNIPDASTAPKQEERPKKESLSLFISYAHKDEVFKDEFKIHLTPYTRNAPITIWDDRAIDAGDDWYDDILQNLHKADIIVFLISPDSMYSRFINDVELTAALERHRAKEARIIPILIRPSAWKESPLKEIQVLPRDAKPITELPNRDRAWVDVVEQIKRVAARMLG